MSPQELPNPAPESGPDLSAAEITTETQANLTRLAEEANQRIANDIADPRNASRLTERLRQYSDNFRALSALTRSHPEVIINHLREIQSSRCLGANESLVVQNALGSLVDKDNPDSIMNHIDQLVKYPFIEKFLQDEILAKEPWTLTIYATNYLGQKWGYQLLKDAAIRVPSDFVADCARLIPDYPAVGKIAKGLLDNPRLTQEDKGILQRYVN